MAKYVMALDAGTTSNRCILFNEKVLVLLIRTSQRSVSPTSVKLLSYGIRRPDSPSITRSCGSAAELLI